MVVGTKPLTGFGNKNAFGLIPTAILQAFRVYNSLYRRLYFICTK